MFFIVKFDVASQFLDLLFWGEISFKSSLNVFSLIFLGFFMVLSRILIWMYDDLHGLDFFFFLTFRFFY